jgi:serine/threonine protein kinase/Tfp pilus assembly protein PilF
MSASASSADPLGRLADEFLERYRRGEQPALTEYTDRHPALAEQIRELFPALMMMEDVRPGPRAVVGAPGAAGPPRCLGEYRIVREIGRGGMGIVYEAEQESLGRRVALKVLPPGATAYPKQVERFQREARAAARLHHTSIVPVFGVGEENGTYYYVMQYIEGRPLDEVLAELCRARDREAASAAPPESSSRSGIANHLSADVARSLWHGRFRAAADPNLPESSAPSQRTRHDFSAGPPSHLPPDPVLRAPEESALLQTETQADAGTISGSSLNDPRRPYVQSVAHVGVQVADALEYAASQGVLHRDIKPSNLLLDVWGAVWLTDFGLAKASGTDDLTGTGDLLGTLRYMAPERFRGQTDVRNDVYSLGLTLYEMLALRPAFDAEDQGELLQQITSTEPPQLNELVSGLPRDLVTIVRKAMAKDPADRYQTPGALADDLRRFLDDRPIRARRLHLPEQAWRWCRRNPTIAALLAALIALVGLAIGGGLWFERKQAERLGRAREALSATLDRAKDLRRQRRWAEAVAVLEHGKGRLNDANSDELRRQLEQVERDVDLASRLETIRLQRAGVGGIIDHDTAAKRYMDSFSEAGLTTPGGEEEAAARIQKSAIRDQLIAGLDDWALDEFVSRHRQDPTRWERVVQLARLADPDPNWRDSFRNPRVWENRRALERLAELAPVDKLSPQLVATLGNLLRMAEAEREALLRKAHDLHPDDFWLNFDLGFALAARGENGKAVGFFRAALARQPQSSKVCHHLGLALWNDNQLKEAAGAFQRAIEIDPGLVDVRIDLGNVLTASGRLGDAAEAFRRAVQIAPRSVRAHLELGSALAADGQMEEATRAFRHALEIVPDSADDYGELAENLSAKGRLQEAIVAFRRAVELGCKNSAILTNFGEALRITGQLDAALTVYRRAVELDPPRGGQAYCNIGLVFHSKGQLKRAEEAYRRAIQLDPKLAEAYCDLGQLLLCKGQMNEALDTYNRALKLNPTMADGHLGLGEALLQQGRYTEARAATQRSLDLLARGDRLRPVAQQQLDLLEHLPALESKLVAVFAGKAQPGAAEQRDLARLSQFGHRRYATATRLYAAAFSADPKLADDQGTRDRHAAARAAAMAAFAQGADQGKLDAREKARLRMQAHEWLTADLDAWTKLLEKAPRDTERVEWTLWSWKGDGDLAGIREAGWLSELPADEQAAWKRFWSRVDGLLQQAERRSNEVGK